MNRRRIAEWFTDRMKELSISGFDERLIDYGNSAFKRGGKSFWVKMRTAFGERLVSSETVERRKVKVRIELCFTLGVGAERGENLASMICAILEPGDSAKGGFMTSDGVRFYAVSVTQLELEETAEYASFPIVFDLVMLRSV